MTKIFHPNVSEKGEICVNTLKKDWNPTNWSIFNILEVVNFFKLGCKMFIDRAVSWKCS